jgi:hypothetical protein
VPHHVRLRITVEQEEWWSAAAMPYPNCRLPTVDLRQFETFEHRVRSFTLVGVELYRMFLVGCDSKPFPGAANDSSRAVDAPLYAGDFVAMFA